ncbi:MAG: NifB/NifX family molybdenum-iron cluster-binding protein [Desulfuromonadaceae bacterium]|nr:NifB/NifX family molybdenum-iron cluster-binding protein [Desulfuromonas sp.]MDY0185547.1 NifB/NifX family molybdenum-iron cluster-binding protein [Desulfuromonadaceae bacterium]
MNVAFSATGTDLDSDLDQRFGRAKQFIIVNTDTDAASILENTQNMNAAQGAGIQAAQNVVNAGATAVVTGNCGPKAFQVLQAAGVKIYHTKLSSVGAALKAFLAGELEEASSANAEAHWS